MQYFPFYDKLSTLPDWVTIPELSRATGIKSHRLRRNIYGVKHIKLGQAKNSTVLYHTPDIQSYFAELMLNT